MASATFEINTTPHEATVGDEVFLFEPEVLSEDFLDGWATLRAATAAAKVDLAGDTPEQIKERTRASNAAAHAFLAGLMVDESAARFLERAPKLPDRVILELQRWILGVYGLRPTGASSESSAPSSSPTPGDDSTGTSPPEG